MKKFLCAFFIFVIMFCDSMVFAKNTQFSEKPSDVEIAKTEIELESFLKEECKGYKYTITNNGPKTYNLKIDIKAMKRAYKEAAKTFRKDMLHQTSQRAVGSLVGTPLATGTFLGQVAVVMGFATVVTVVFPPLGMMIFIDVFGNGDMFDGLGEFYAERGKDITVRPAKSLLNVKKDIQKNIKGTKEAKSELRTYILKDDESFEIKPGESFEFYVITPKRSWGAYLKLIQENNVYKFIY